MKNVNTFDFSAQIAISGSDLNDIAAFADIDTAELIDSTAMVLYEAERKDIHEDTLYYLARNVIQICSDIGTLNRCIDTSYKNANNNSKP